MEIPNLPIEAVFKRVRGAVAEKSKGAQIPWEASSLIGDFVFNLRATPASPPPPATAFDARQIDLAYWNAIKDSSDPTAFQEYLNEQPNGKFTSLARRKVNELTSKPQIVAASPVAALPAQQPTPIAPSVAAQQVALLPPSATDKASADTSEPSIRRFDGEYRVSVRVTHAGSGEIINRPHCKTRDQTVVTVRAGVLALDYDTNPANNVRGAVGEDGRIAGKSSNSSQPTSLAGKIENGRVTGEMWSSLCGYSVSSTGP